MMGNKRGEIWGFTIYPLFSMVDTLKVLAVCSPIDVHKHSFPSLFSCFLLIVAVPSYTNTHASLVSNGNTVRHTVCQPSFLILLDHIVIVFLTHTPIHKKKTYIQSLASVISKSHFRNNWASTPFGLLMYIFSSSYNIFLFCWTNRIIYHIYEPKAHCLLHQIFLLGLELHYGIAAVPFFLPHSHSISHLFLISNKLSLINRLQFDLLFDVFWIKKRLQVWMLILIGQSASIGGIWLVYPRELWKDLWDLFKCDLR